LLLAHTISFARADFRVWPLVTQRSVSDLPLGKTPEFGALVELPCRFYIRQRPHYANLPDYAGYCVCTVTTNTDVTIFDNRLIDFYKKFEN